MYVFTRVWNIRNIIIDNKFSGPEHWADSYPICGLDAQSPINIDSRCEYNADLTEINFVGYDDVPANTAWSIANNGHSGKYPA